MRVNSEKQTLILAGEPVPQRFAYNASPPGRPLTLVATPVDDPMLIVQDGFQEAGLGSLASSGLSALPRNLVSSDIFADRGSANSAANAYARTQRLSSDSARSAIIDTYA